jgi:hypothetical protein
MDFVDGFLSSLSKQPATSIALDAKLYRLGRRWESRPICIPELERKGHYPSGPLQGNEKPIREHAVSASAQGIPAVRSGTWKYIPAPGSGGWGKGGDQSQAVQL